MVCYCNPSTGDVEAGGNHKLDVNLSYTAKGSLKKQVNLLDSGGAHL